MQDALLGSQAKSEGHAKLHWLNPKLAQVSFTE
jgi:hypothetical protein